MSEGYTLYEHYLNDRIKELEQKVEQYKQITEFSAFTVGCIDWASMNREECARYYQMAVDETSRVLDQNAKLVKALKKIASCLPWHDEENAKVCVEIAKAVLKEVER